jgi:hypothetical protein
MLMRDFCFWLQGYFELINGEGSLTAEQVEMIKSHLSLVFVHEIDPSMGDEKHQQKLDKVHTTTGPKPHLRPQHKSDEHQKMRC